MDLQDLFFSLTEGWLKRHLWLGTGQGVFTTWHVFNSHMQWHRGRMPSQQSSRFTYTNMHTRMAASANLFDVCIFLLPWEWFLEWRACMCECVSLWMPVWLCHPRVALFASVNKWPHPIMSFRSQMPSNKLLISHLFMHSPSPLKHLLPLSLTPTLKELKTGRGEHKVTAHYEVIVSDFPARSH